MCFVILRSGRRSALAVLYQPGAVVRSLTSVTAAGILISAVALEMLPILTEEEASWYAASGGFASGIAFFIFLGQVLPDPDEEPEDGEDGEERRSEVQGAGPAEASYLTPSRTRSHSGRLAGLQTHTIPQQAGPGEHAALLPKGGSGVGAGQRDDGTRTPRPETPSLQDAMRDGSDTSALRLPWTRLAVVTLDGFFDGLTLGVAASVSTILVPP